MIRPVVAALGLALVISSAAAERPLGQNQPPNQWVMNCNTEKGRDCTVSAMIDGGPNNLLGTFLIVSYSVAYTTLTVVVDGMGQRASMQIDQWPWITTNICTGGACSYEQTRSSELLQELLRGQQVTIQVSMQDGSMAGPLSQSLSGFATQYQRAVRAQQGR
jgi:invasion protein IalB